MLNPPNMIILGSLQLTLVLLHSLSRQQLHQATSTYLLVYIKEALVISSFLSWPSSDISPTVSCEPPTACLPSFADGRTTPAK